MLAHVGWGGFVWYCVVSCADRIWLDLTGKVLNVRMSEVQADSSSWKYLQMKVLVEIILPCQPRTGTISQNNFQGIWNNLIIPGYGRGGALRYPICFFRWGLSANLGWILIYCQDGQDGLPRNLQGDDNLFTLKFQVRSTLLTQSAVCVCGGNPCTKGL